jgi:hypothetical protein
MPTLLFSTEAGQPLPAHPYPGDLAHQQLPAHYPAPLPGDQQLAYQSLPTITMIPLRYSFGKLLIDCL